MDTIPAYISYTFVAITVATLSFVIYAVSIAAPDKRNNTSTIVLTFLVIWLFVIALATFQDFFADQEAFPPRLFLPIVSALLAILILFIHPSSRRFILEMPITTLTYIHIIRIPVEIVLWWLSNHGAVPQEMTFAGTNYDILTGVTAPFAAIFLVGMRSQSTFAAIVWNLAGLGLLFNIVLTAIRATPYFYNPDLFSIPNVAVFEFPFIWLPTFVVPCVFFCHVASIFKLIKGKEEE